MATHIDRAIELINRTNQLNFTKRRLPENIVEARRALKDELAPFSRQAGIVRVVDNYGDYGFVGIFVTETLRHEYVPGASNRTLRHFCFSCRTLGMLVEQWVYEYLARPQLHVVGDVLTDLSARRNIDWITLLPSLSGTVTQYERIAPELRVYGGCEADAVGVYLKAHSDKVEVMGNFRAGGLFVRINGAALALSLFDRNSAEFADESEALHLPFDLMARDFFAGAAFGTVFIFSCGLDARGRFRYRHRKRGWEIVLEPMGCPALDFNTGAEEKLLEQLESSQHKDTAHFDNLVNAARHIRANYDTVASITDEQKEAALRALIHRVPVDSKFIILLDHDRVRGEDGILRTAHYVTQYNSLVISVAKDYPFVATVSFTDAIDSEDQIQAGGNHYDRVVYLRIAERLVEAVRKLSSKAANMDDAA